MFLPEEPRLITFFKSLDALGLGTIILINVPIKIIQKFKIFKH